MTKTRIAWGFGSLALLLMTANLLVTPPWTDATPVGVLSDFVVKDNNGDVVGPVVSYEFGVNPVVAYDGDIANGGRRTLLKMRTAVGFQPEQFQTFFANMDCTGQAYLRPPSTRGGIEPLTGVGYGVGPDNATGIGANIWLYRSDSAGPGSSVTYDSLYTTSSPDFTNASNCQNSNATTTLVTATKRVNVTQNFPQPYTAE